MERLIILNNRTNREYKIEAENTQSYFDNNLSGNELAWGKSARWIDILSADEWEKSREDDRRVVEVSPEHEVIVQDNDINGEPIGEPYLITIPAVTRTEIHVPDDYALTITDITLELANELKLKKLTVKKNLAIEAIIFINSIIDEWIVNDKLTLLARSDIQTVLTFLNYGSIEQSRDLCQTLTTDLLLTQEVKDSVVNFLNDKITQFNGMVWS